MGELRDFVEALRHWMGSAPCLELVDSKRELGWRQPANLDWSSQFPEDPDAIRRLFFRSPQGALRLLEGASRAAREVAAELCETHAVLARDPEPSVREAVAWYTKEAALLADLSEDANPLVRRHVAANRATPAEVIERLAEDVDSTVRTWVAGRSKLAPEVLITLLCDPSEEVRKRVVRKSKLPMMVVRAAHARGSLEATLALARGGATAEELLTLAKHEELAVRRAVAGREKLPEAVVAILSADEEDSIGHLLLDGGYLGLEAIRARAESGLAYAARHLLEVETLDAEALTALASTFQGRPEADSVLSRIADQPACPEALLEQLVDHSKDLRLRLARRPDLPEAMQLRLAQDADGNVRSCLARNPHGAQAIFEVLAADPYPAVRSGLATNGSVPETIRATLQNDPDERVQRALKRHALRESKPSHED